MSNKKPLDFDKMFDDYFHGNPKVWEFDRADTLGASEAFGCLRQALFEKRGEEFKAKPDPDFENRWGAMERGNIIEDYYFVPAIKFGKPRYVKLKRAGQDNQKTLVKGKNSATPDGLLTNLKSNALANYGVEDIGGDCIMAEVKSIDPRSTLKEAKTIHFGQTQMQMGLMRDTSKYKPNYAMLFYINCSFLDDVKYFPIKFDPNIYKAGQVRGNKLYQVTSIAEISPEGKDTPKGCDYCRWQMACAEASGEAFPEDNEDEIDEMLIDMFDPLANEHIKFKFLEEKNKALKTKTARKIKDLLQERNHRRIGKPENWSIAYSWNDGRVTLDTEAMKKDGIDIEKYQKTGAGFDKLLVTKKEPSDG